MVSQGRVTFQHWILPNERDGGVTTTAMPPPKYARKPGFTFGLDSITSDGHGGLTIGAIDTGTWAMQVQMPQDPMTLDHGQCQELLVALTREHNLIQGPTGAPALDDRLQGCYYDHTLDQFLKHLLEAGISKIILVGGRSIAPELEDKSLQIDHLAPRLAARRVRGRLADSHTTRRENIDALYLTERWALADFWLSDLRSRQTDYLFESPNEAERLHETINGAHDGANRRALIQADVVGITTTALARNNMMLRHLDSKVIICEEAAKVIESRIRSAVMPRINNYSLSIESNSGLKWQLERGQFERRAVGEPGLAPFPMAQLNVQRRMRPCISRLTRSAYPTSKTTRA
ncbi:hypothetical protein DL767_007329 [Monosporascus sp. MG133]|nr:hypothetical protein DL767_007329 [Monosporascus sp. MG133]